ncbi:Pentatricopeptide repeat [Dillenia turbinata]|uniref:Pentatricopeptide repeat n=1 Tax=Dillenia turbinata TaxID=194707 RepID=A0AAN8YX89_9MAGN
MNPSANETAKLISRTLISASKTTVPACSWSPSLEQILHRLLPRDTLTPSIVAQVIDPHLLYHHSLSLGFFNWVSQQPNFSHTSLTYQSVLKSLSTSHQFSSIESLLKQVRARKIVLNFSVYQSVITSQLKSNKTHNAFLTFNEVSQMGIEIGPETCNSLLASLSSERNFACAQKVFDEMISKEISLSTVGFGLFIWMVSGDAELGVILGLIDKVRKYGSMINGSVVALLIIHGLCRVGRVSEAFWLLEELRNRDCKPDFMAYRIVAEGYRMIGKREEVEGTLKKKRKLGVAPRANDYREFIFDLISERLIREAKEVVEVIVDGNFPIEDDVLNSLIGAVSAIDSDSPVRFLKFMIGKERLPSIATVSKLSRNLVKHGKTDELLEVFETLSSNNYFSDLESYNVMIVSLCKAGRLKEAYGVLQEMKKKGLSPDIQSYNNIMEACCREDLLRPAKRLWDEMFANGLGGNLKTYSILIQKFSEMGQIEEAKRLFYNMLDKGMVPDALVYTSLLQGLCQEFNITTALEVFDKCGEQDKLLSYDMLSTFICSLCKGGHFRAASKLLCDLTHGAEHLESHVVLLKFLVDSSEVLIATEHLKWVGSTSPSLLKNVAKELRLLFSSSPSSSTKPVLQLLNLLEEKEK